MKNIDEIKKTLEAILNDERALEALTESINPWSQDDEGNQWCTAKQAAKAWGILAFYWMGVQEDYMGNGLDYIPFWETPEFGEVQRIIKNEPDKEKIGIRRLKYGDFLITVYNEN